MRLTPKDKRVISVFFDRKNAYYGSKNLSTDGKELIAYPTAPLPIASWEGEHIRLQDTSNSEAVIVRYLTKKALQGGIRVFDAFGNERS